MYSVPEVRGAIIYGTSDVRFEVLAEPTIVKPTDAYPAAALAHQVASQTPKAPSPGLRRLAGSPGGSHSTEE